MRLILVMVVLTSLSGCQVAPVERDYVNRWRTTNHADAANLERWRRHAINEMVKRQTR